MSTNRNDTGYAEIRQEYIHYGLRSTRAWEKAYGLLCRVLASITYDDEEQARQGLYGLPIDICELLDDFIANDCPPSIQEALEISSRVNAPHYFKKDDGE